MIVRRIHYRDYADRNGIDRCLKTVKDSYDADTKTVEVKIGYDGYDDYDDVIIAMTSVDAMVKFMAEQGEVIYADQAKNLIEDNISWMSEFLSCSEKECRAILKVM